MPQELIDFFSFLLHRQLSDAEELLYKISNNMENSRKNDGFLKALEGLLQGMKSPEGKNLYINQILSSKETTLKAKKEFEQHATNPLHNPYDQGFFSALMEFLDFYLQNNFESTNVLIDKASEYKEESS